MKIWELVKDIEEKASFNDAQECRATMIVNFGPEGKCHSGLVTGKESLLQMFVKVLEFYETKLRRKNNENHTQQTQ